MPRKRSEYKDPPRYEFIIPYEQEMKENFKSMIEDTREMLEQRLKQIAEES